MLPLYLRLACATRGYNYNDMEKRWFEHLYETLHHNT